MTLVVYGANGATGARCVELAVAAGLRPVVAGRNRAALETVAAPAGLEVRVGGLDELDRLFSDAAVVISCVAPYSRLGLAVLEPTLRAGASYIDCTGEPRYVHRLLASYDAAARSAGSTIVPAAGIGCAANLVGRDAAASLARVERLTIDYRVRGMVPSWGTTSSTALILAGDVAVRRGGAVTWERPGSSVGAVPGGRGAAFPLTDVLTLGQQFPEAEIRSYLRSPVAPLLARVMAGAAAAARRPGFRHNLDRAARPLDRLRPRGEFHITIGATGGGETSVSRAAAADIYETTSLAAVEIASRLLEGAAAPGFQASGQVVGDPREVAPRIGLTFT